MHLNDEDFDDTAPGLLWRFDNHSYVIQWLSEAAKVSCDPFRKMAVRFLSGRKVAECCGLAGAKSWAAIVSARINRPRPA